jgi:hypothetical protein
MKARCLLLSSSRAYQTEAIVALAAYLPAIDITSAVG